TASQQEWVVEKIGPSKTSAVTLNWELEPISNIEKAGADGTFIRLSRNPTKRPWPGVMSGGSSLLERVKRAETILRPRKSCSRPGQLSPQVNIKPINATSPQSGKSRSSPPDTCRMAFEKDDSVRRPGGLPARSVR